QTLRFQLLPQLSQYLHRPTWRARPDALETQKRTSHLPSLVSLPQDAVGRHHHIVKEHFAKIWVAPEICYRPHGDPRKVHVDQHEADPFLLRSGSISSDQTKHMCRDVRRRGPYLLAIDDDLVTVDTSVTLQTGKIRSRGWLGVALAPDVLAGMHFGQVVSLLLLRSPRDDRGA